MDKFAFFKKPAVKAAVTVAFGVAAMTAFYLTYSNMYAEQLDQTPSFGL
ncbi:hypothetical protein [Legionella massiliensis]|nr:hypothetical protein [Legionella massiliensis]